MIQKKRAAATKRPSTKGARSPVSISPLASLYADRGFQLAWDNDLPFHLAEQLIALRKYRNFTQAQLAAACNAGQPQIARLEAGGGNATLTTIMRVASALRGRICFALQPEECDFPRLPSWTEQISHGMVSTASEALGNPQMLRHTSAEDVTHVMAAWKVTTASAGDFFPVEGFRKAGHAASGTDEAVLDAKMAVRNS